MIRLLRRLFTKQTTSLPPVLIRQIARQGFKGWHDGDWSNRNG